MGYYDVIDVLVDGEKPSPSEKDYFKMYKEALKMLNKIKLSRFKAMYFGSMQVGNPEMYEWKKLKDFTVKYQSACIYVMRNLYDSTKDKKILVETALSILYSMLANYFDDKELDDEANKLIDENDKYVKSSDLEGEFFNG